MIHLMLASVRQHIAKMSCHHFQSPCPLKVQKSSAQQQYCSAEVVGKVKSVQLPLTKSSTTQLQSWQQPPAVIICLRAYYCCQNTQLQLQQVSNYSYIPSIIGAVYMVWAESFLVRQVHAQQSKSNVHHLHAWSNERTWGTKLKIAKAYHRQRN